MSFRLEMLQVARLAPELLGGAAGLVCAWLRRQMLECGAFPDRAGRADLYYTVFGIEGMLALRDEPPWPLLMEWLRDFGDGEGLDFVHLCCLARCWAAAPVKPPESVRAGVVERLRRWRSADGGYHQREGSPNCSAYGCLLGWAAHGDLRGELPEAANLVACLARLRSGDGAWANEPKLPHGTTSATAAALALHRHLRLTPPLLAGEWLLQQLHPQGGFRALPGAPMPDLLSTAVVLHALDGLQLSFAAHKDSLLDYVDSLWNAEGGFHGHWADDTLDVEYTYYGLLALGHLAL